MDSDNEGDKRRIARQRVQARTAFAIHVMMYVAVNGGLFGIWLMTGQGYPWFVWPVLGWGVGLLAHGVTLLFGPDTALEERMIRRELRRMQH